MKKEVDSMELPNTKAFQDEFTRSLLDSPEEVEKGYYLFKSDTGGYSMLWPKDAVTDGPPFYQRTGESFEKIQFYERNEKENYDDSFSTTFSTYGEDSLESRLNILSSGVSYYGEYEEIETDKTLIYYAKKELPLKYSTAYFYFGYILSKENEKGLEYIYVTQCIDESKRNCNIDTEQEEKRALYYMQSVIFNKDE
ncbi:hypothetical protein ACNRWW_10445 [Metabacillus sp. HB246100]